MHPLVRLAVGDKVPVDLYNWTGGIVPSTQAIMDRLLDGDGLP